MTTTYTTLLPDTYAPAYQTRVAYFSMEYAIAQSLKIYAGGLGYLAGSHLRSAYALKQNVVGIGILWKYGYYDQIRKPDQTMGVLFQEKVYSFLQKLDLRFQILVNQAPVQVEVYYLPPATFGTAPLYLLSTDLPENDYLAQTITHKLYDPDKAARIAASILLGVGGAKLLELLGIAPNIYHLNEAHALPLVFSLYEKYGHVAEVRKKVVFTTHTPEEAGNEKTDIGLLDKMSFFSNVELAQVRQLTGIAGDVFDHSLAALRLSKAANAVSRLHGEVTRKMWAGYSGISPITAITNAQSYSYWADVPLYEYLGQEADGKLAARKKELKRQLLEEVADQTGDLLDENVLTLVWARRFAGYKRADLLLEDLDRFYRLLANQDLPIQIIWAGKPYPMDYAAISVFDRLVHLSKKHTNCSILVGYELRLSKLLKQGADVWLNTPLVTREASGTSGMTAAMNGAVLLSTADGWVPEFIRPGHNGFMIPPADAGLPLYQQNKRDAQLLLDTLENQILPLYYQQPGQWLEIMKTSLREVVPFFDSDRLAREYYEKLYLG
jgi:glycogen phosphorylase